MQNLNNHSGVRGRLRTLYYGFKKIVKSILFSLDPANISSGFGTQSHGAGPKALLVEDVPSAGAAGLLRLQIVMGAHLLSCLFLWL